MSPIIDPNLPVGCALLSMPDVEGRAFRRGDVVLADIEMRTGVTFVMLDSEVEVVGHLQPDFDIPSPTVDANGEPMSDLPEMGEPETRG